MDQRIIQSIIEITRSRDTDTLEASLLSILADLVPLQRISLINLVDELKIAKCEQSIMLSISDTNSRHWQDEVKPVTLSETVVKHLNDGRLAIDTGDDVTVIHAPILDGNLPVCAVRLESSEPELAAYANVIEGICGIYANFLRVLEDSQRDKLTGLLNRRTFDKKLVRMMELQRQVVEEYGGQGNDRRQPALFEYPWLAIVDIDNFKRVNDLHGHIYGDEVILTVGHRMRQFFRNSDLLFRFGGEEFLIVLEPMPQERARMALDRFRGALADHVFPQIGGITVSIGFARLEQDAYPPEVIDRADKALYFAKTNGRDQVANYERLLSDDQIEPRAAAPGEIDLF